MQRTFQQRRYPDPLRWLASLYRKCKELKVRAPISVGMAPNIDHLILLDPVSDVLTIHPYGNRKFLDAAVAYGEKVGKPVLGNRVLLGIARRCRAGENHTELSQLRDRNLGFLAHVLHHSLVADCHRPKSGP